MNAKQIQPMPDRVESNELRASLDHFIGTVDYHRETFRGDFFCTDGMVYVANACGAFWLIDAIASYQHRKEMRCEDFQVWTLHVDGHMASLLCTDGDKGDGPVELARQVIPYTDFPEGVWKFYCERGSLDGEHTCQILMLPQEH